MTYRVSILLASRVRCYAAPGPWSPHGGPRLTLRAEEAARLSEPEARRTAAYFREAGYAVTTTRHENPAPDAP